MAANSGMQGDDFVADAGANPRGDTDPMARDLDRNHDGCFVPDPEFRLVPKALEEYVTKDSQTGNIYVLEPGFLTPELIQSEDAPTVLLGEEKDITDKVKGKLSKDATKTDQRAFTFAFGWKYPRTGEAARSVVITGAGYESRPDIGVKKAQSGDGGRDTTYGVTYAIIAIPEDRFDFMMRSLGVAGIEVELAENQKRSAGFVWTQVNIISGSHPAGYMEGPRGLDKYETEQRSLMHLIRKITLRHPRHTVLGNITLEPSLKRAPHYRSTNRVYNITFGLVSMVCTDITAKRSPDIRTAAVYIKASGQTASNALLAALDISGGGGAGAGAGARLPAGASRGPGSVRSDASSASAATRGSGAARAAQGRTPASQSSAAAAGTASPARISNQEESLDDDGGD